MHPNIVSHTNIQIDIDTTTGMLKHISKHGNKKYIFLSTVAIYRTPVHSNPTNEDDEKDPISPYGAPKLAREVEANKFLAIPGDHGIVLHNFNVVGPAAP